jgi:hypothetical protein
MRNFLFTIAVLFLTSFCCNKTCNNCMSVAFRIKLVDATTGTPLANALVVAHVSQQTSDTAHFAAVDSEYEIFGLPGTYSLDVSQENYQSFSIPGLTVGQWDQDQCNAHASTVNMTIKVSPASAQKSAAAKTAPYEIVRSFASGGC